MRVLLATIFITACSGFHMNQLRATSKLVVQQSTNNFEPLRRGSTVALVTPNGEVDFRGLRNLLQFHLTEGTDNLCILGTTGEVSVLSMQERLDVLSMAVDLVKGKIPILAGIGAIDYLQVKAQTQQAMDIGCDAGLLVTPYYVKPPQRCLINHAVSVADLGLPLVLYNVPGRTGVDFADSSIAIAAQHPSIVGLKDATGNLQRLDSLKEALENEGVSKEFLCFSGDDSTTKDYILRGGDGCISVTANCDPNHMHHMAHAALARNACLANSINDSTPFCRPPLDRIDPFLERDVEMALQAAGIIPTPQQIPRDVIFDVYNTIKVTV